MKEDENPQYYNIAHENAGKAGYTLTLSFLKFYQKDIFSQELNPFAAVGLHTDRKIRQKK